MPSTKKGLKMPRLIRITNNLTDRYLTQQAGDRAAGLFAFGVILWLVVAPILQRFFGE